MDDLSFGLLDFGLRNTKMNSMVKLDDVVESAILAEQLGFSRYWIGEHHASVRNMAWSNPQAVLPLLASSTNKIRIGIAGILLSLYSPYHVATFFKLLNNIFHCRIDLGIANGRPCKDAIRFSTEQEELDREAFERKLKELIYLLRSDKELYRDGQGVVIPPYMGAIPEIWTLTSSAYRSGNRIIDLKTNLCRSLYHEKAEKEFAKNRLMQIREEYFNKYGEFPKVSLAIGVVCHETMRKALDAARKLENARDSLTIVGCPSFFRDRIIQLRKDYGVKEFIIYIYALNPEERHLTMNLISEVFNLKSATLCQV